jgi:hypothetical protein
MDKKIAGLLGSVAALGTVNAAQASPALATDVLKANSYADLLKPIPNAADLLRVVDKDAPQPSTKADIQLAQAHHHHHHHHHSYSRRPVVVVGRRHRHHHHHHHHHHHN